MALIQGKNVSGPVALGQHHDGSVGDAETQRFVFAKDTTSCPQRSFVTKGSRR